MSEVMEKIKKEQGNECQIKQQIDNSGEADLMCSGGIGEECDFCEKTKKAEEKLVYQTGGQKINAEAEEQYEKAKGKETAEMMKTQMAPIIEYVTKKCEADAEYNALVLQTHKTWVCCYEFMMDKAQKMAASGSTGLLVEGTTILKWIDEYYQLDDKAKVEKEAAEKSKKKTVTKGNSEKGKSQSPTVHETKAAGKKGVPADDQKTGKKKNEMEGQIWLFDMM